MKLKILNLQVLFFLFSKLLQTLTHNKLCSYNFCVSFSNIPLQILLYHLDCFDGCTCVCQTAENCQRQTSVRLHPRSILSSQWLSFFATCCGFCDPNSTEKPAPKCKLLQSSSTPRSRIRWVLEIRLKLGVGRVLCGRFLFTKIRADFEVIFLLSSGRRKSCESSSRS